MGPCWFPITQSFSPFFNLCYILIKMSESVSVSINICPWWDSIQLGINVKVHVQPYNTPECIMVLVKNMGHFPLTKCLYPQ